MTCNFSSLPRAATRFRFSITWSDRCWISRHQSKDPSLSEMMPRKLNLSLRDYRQPLTLLLVPNSAQSHEIRLPQNFTCEDCTMRLLRQADEWTNSYRFWSCADIDIKPRREYRETCSSHGKYLATKCKCDKNYYGSRCQYWDECTTDQDCGLQGKCVDIGGTALPRKQCYCNLGWYGPGCNKSTHRANNAKANIFTIL
jgi:EGF-like domain